MSASQKFTPQDWAGSTARMNTTAVSNRVDSETVRGDALNHTRATTSSLAQTQRDVQHKIALRLDEIEERAALLQATIDEVFTETGHLLSHKDTLDKELAAKELPLQIAKECLKIREGRQGIDLVADPVEAQLKQEVTLLENIKHLLSSEIAEAVEQIRLLRASSFQLEADLKDKNNARHIDQTAASLNTTSHSLGFNPSATKTLSKAVLPEDWDNFSLQNISKAQQERLKSVALREHIDQTLRDTAAQLTNQSNAVDAAFNARLAESNDARNEAKQQLAKTQIELTNQEKLLKDLTALHTERQGPLKLAATRLDTRAARPNVELVHDPVHTSLVQEVNLISLSLEQLNQKIEETKSTIRGLVRAENLLQEDIAVKTNSITLDTKCMQRRQQYKYRN